MAKETKYEQHEVTVNCSCKNSFVVNFSKDMPKIIAIEKCNKCHPAYNKTKSKTVDNRNKKVAKFNESCDFSSLFND